MPSKCGKLKPLAEAVSMIFDGARIMVGGFGDVGVPNKVIDALSATNLKDLTIISNDLGSPGIGLGRLLRNHQIKKLIGTYYNWNPEVADAFNNGEIDVELIPQGTMAEAIRTAGLGIPAFYCPTGVGTALAKGKEVRIIDGKEYVLERSLRADFSIIKAHVSDELGNLTFCKTARNFNPVMALGARVTIAEVDEIVPTGELDPECVITPHIFVNVICL